MKETDIKQRWQRCFYKLLNDVGDKDIVWGDLELSRDNKFCRCITIEEVKEVLHRMRRGRVVRPDEIPVEIWRCFDEEGIV